MIPTKHDLYFPTKEEKEYTDALKKESVFTPARYMPDD